VVSQIGVGLEQFELSTHSTQMFVARSHVIAPGTVHCALLTQPGAHVWVPLRHTGVDGVVQSAFTRQDTHMLVAVSQRAVVPEQLASDTHWTHCFVVGSQAGVSVGQSVDVLHPTQAPVAVSQVLAAAGHAGPPSTAHDAWHVWVLGQQAGVVPE
jgi:hypothetical protein